MNTLRLTLRALAVAGLCICAAQSIAERRPVLDQIQLPHAYYFREMYLPQVTRGPSSLAWSPDSRELVYSMGGTLWRQRLDSGIALQLTDGQGLDYQPDWSPDGRRVAYVSYADGALEIRLLELASGQSTAVTHNGAVNLEPRWSPDGRRLVFVSTAGTGHFHLFTVDIGPTGVGTPQPLTVDSRSLLPRYYYSAFDHEINPSWSPDGREILYVSNRGHIHGTGGIWRMPAVRGASGREIHYEETNWRARPELSPDGSLLLYSSYVGRNTHQLWLQPARGGDPLPLTYGDWDATAARWSPDGQQIAFISNQNGDLELRLLSVPGHDGRPLPVTKRVTLRPTGTLIVRVSDESGQPLAARLGVTDGTGHPYAAAGSWLHADDSYDRAEASRERFYFHSAGEAVVEAPAGELLLEVAHGLEAAPVREKVALRAGETLTVTVTLHKAPFTTTPGRRWVSGDAHVHMNYAGAYRNDPAHLALQATAEDLAFVHALVVNKEQRFPDIAYGGAGGDLATAGATIVHGQEFHTSYWGHMGILHPAGGPILPGYAGYPNTAAASLAPMNATVADLAHAQGAVVGYVHPFDDLPEPLARPSERLTSELPVDVALGKVDYIEVLGFSDHRTTAEVWYRLLNLGFRVPAAAGTDAMANYASLRGPVGLNRVYVDLPEGEHGVGAWLDGLKAGRTFATNGPLLGWTLAGKGPGEEAKFASPGEVPFTARLRSLVPIDRLEVVCDGRVIRSLIDGPVTDVTVSATLQVEQSGWCLLRAEAKGVTYPLQDNYVYATTTPVYLEVAGQPARSAGDARYFLAWIDRVREATRAYPDWRSAAEKQAVLDRLEAAAAIFRARQ